MYVTFILPSDSVNLFETLSKEDARKMMDDFRRNFPEASRRMDWDRMVWEWVIYRARHAAQSR